MLNYSNKQNKNPLPLLTSLTVGPVEADGALTGIGVEPVHTRPLVLTRVTHTLVYHWNTIEKLPFLCYKTKYKICIRFEERFFLNYSKDVMYQLDTYELMEEERKAAGI